MSETAVSNANARKVVWVDWYYEGLHKSHEAMLEANTLIAKIYLAPKDAEVWGDDWNDNPAFCNAGRVYDYTWDREKKTPIDFEIIEVRLGLPLMKENNKESSSR